jgi:hypothetical protein
MNINIDLDNSTSLKIFHFFTLGRYKNLRNYLSEFFCYYEILKYSNINKNFLQLAKTKYDLISLKLINNKYLRQKLPRRVKIDSYCLQHIYDEIIKNENQIDFNSLNRHFSYLLFSKICTERISFFYIEKNSLIPYFLNYLKEFIIDINLNSINLFYLKLSSITTLNLTKNLLEPSLIIKQVKFLTINHSNLNSECLKVIINFIKKSYSLINLDLSNTQIGKIENSLELLKITNNLSFMYLSNNQFSMSPEMIEIIKKNKRIVFKMLNNDFTHEDFLFFSKQVKLFCISSFHVSNYDSPRYTLMNFNNSLTYTNSAESQEYFEKYIVNFKFKTLNIDFFPTTASVFDMENIKKICLLPRVKHLEISKIPKNLVDTILTCLENPNINDLNLWDTLIDGGHSKLSQFFDKLISCPNIKKLTVISRPDNIDLLRLRNLIIKNNLILLKLDLKRSSIDDHFINTLIFEILKKNSSIKTLILEVCDISKDNIKFLRKELKSTGKIKILKINNHKFKFINKK